MAYFWFNMLNRIGLENTILASLDVVLLLALTLEMKYGKCFSYYFQLFHGAFYFSLHKLKYYFIC